ncbi:MAG: NACHT domain-containing protein [Cyanobacteria bacterium CRU_2_1]|nr:NACHT domain-containing protein [Cyanobacteria bacterium CRU_2_1]
MALLGMGGVGKTALVAKFARSHHQEFEFIIWRNLRNAPPLEELLAELLQFLSESQEIDRPTPLDGKILQLLKCLRDHRCLLILDGVESILQNGSETHVGGYRAGYEGYGQLLTCIGETQHQSCLVLTSREMPKGLSTLEGEALPVRCLPLKGVTWIEGQQIAQTKGAFTGSEGEWAAFVERYAGNPLVLKIVASTIRAMFGSSIAYFLTLLENSAFLIDEVRDLLEEQFNRLGRLEQDLLHWLAINDKPMTVEELQEGVSYPLSISELMQTIAALQRRSLIEITIEQTTYATQPSIVLRYATNSLIEQISWGMNQQHEIINKPKQYESADTKQLTDPSHKNNKVHSVHTISPQPQFSTANELLTPARV